MDRGPAIVLIGPMGAGKTTIGRALAQLTARPHFDTDGMVEAEARLSIAQIFSHDGEERFRELETEALGRIPTDCAAVVSAGGGIVLRSENVERMRTLGYLIHLTADEETLLERALRDGSRPLLQTNDPRRALSTLLRTREPFYRKAADHTVDTSRLEPDEAAAEIKSWIDTAR